MNPSLDRIWVWVKSQRHKIGGIMEVHPFKLMLYHRYHSIWSTRIGGMTGSIMLIHIWRWLVTRGLNSLDSFQGKSMGFYLGKKRWEKNMKLHAFLFNSTKAFVNLISASNLTRFKCLFRKKNPHWFVCSHSNFPYHYWLSHILPSGKLVFFHRYVNVYQRVSPAKTQVRPRISGPWSGSLLGRLVLNTLRWKIIRFVWLIIIYLFFSRDFQ